MTRELSKNQKIIVLRNGVEIWTDSEKAERFQEDWTNGLVKGAVTFEGRSLNTADVIGVVLPIDMEELRRRKNGQWKCNSGKWHDRGEKCLCYASETLKLLEMRNKVIRDCGKCKNGYVNTPRGTVAFCDCVTNFDKLYGTK